MRSVWNPVLLAFPAMAMLWFSPVWGDVEGGAGTSFVPHCRGLLYFGLFFAVGWALHARPALLLATTKSAGTYLLLALPAFVVMQMLVWAQFTPHASDYRTLKFICLFGAAVYSWSILFALLGIFLRWFDKPNPHVRYAADGSYWAYLVHMPVVAGLQLWLIPAGFSSFSTFILINVFTLALLFLSYHFCVRYTWVGTLLNGRRFRPGKSGSTLAISENAESSNKEKAA
jgi:hypothetical protein